MDVWQGPKYTSVSHQSELIVKNYTNYILKIDICHKPISMINSFTQQQSSLKSVYCITSLTASFNAKLPHGRRT